MDVGAPDSSKIRSSDVVESSAHRDNTLSIAYRHYRAPTTSYKFDLSDANLWVPKPTAPYELTLDCTDENFSKENVKTFLQRWPPSRTPLPYGDFIYVHRYIDPRVGLGISDSKIKSLVESFESLIDDNSVTAESIDKIARQHKLLTGKWMVFAPPDRIDALWAKVVDLVCVYRKSQSANVSTVISPDPSKTHVICVWVEDYTNMDSVKALRRSLRFLGVRERITFKADVYTYLDIYSDNKWRLRPTIYQE